MRRTVMAPTRASLACVTFKIPGLGNGVAGDLDVRLYRAHENSFRARWPGPAIRPLRQHGCLAHLVTPSLPALALIRVSRVSKNVRAYR